MKIKFRQIKKVILVPLLTFLFYSCGGENGNEVNESNQNYIMKENHFTVADSANIYTIIQELLSAKVTGLADMDKSIKNRYVEPEETMFFYNNIINAIWLKKSSKTQLIQGLFSEYKTGNSIVEFILDEIKEY